MPQTILFVDEEKFVHKALKRSFRNMRQEWDMRFASYPSEAMEILNSESIEVVVTETVFQGHSGLDFLKIVSSVSYCTSQDPSKNISPSLVRR